MPVLLQVCVVIVTAALALIAIMTMRAMKRFEKAADEISQTAEMIQRSVAEIGAVTRDAHAVVHSIRDVVPHFTGVAERFERIGQRTAALSSDLLTEVEAPVRTAVAISRAVRSGTAHLVDRLTNRFRSTPSQNNGGFRQ